MAGIKFHAAIDVEISRNHIYRTCRGLWLDWMAQGTRVSRNLFHDNAGEDLFVEVDHGPFLVDNNLFLSADQRCWTCPKAAPTPTTCSPGRSSAGRNCSRETPYHPPHSTDGGRPAQHQGRRRPFYNNIFVGAGEPPAAAGKPAGKGPPRSRRLRAVGVRRPRVPAANRRQRVLPRRQAVRQGSGARRAGRVDPQVKLVEEVVFMHPANQKTRLACVPWKAARSIST